MTGSPQEPAGLAARTARSEDGEFRTSRHDLVHATDDAGDVSQHDMIEAIAGVGLKLARQLFVVADEQHFFDHVEGDRAGDVAEIVGIQIVDDYVSEASAGPA